MQMLDSFVGRQYFSVWHVITTYKFDKFAILPMQPPHPTRPHKIGPTVFFSKLLNIDTVTNLGGKPRFMKSKKMLLNCLCWALDEARKKFF
jgi:hypothetical protein